MEAHRWCNSPACPRCGDVNVYHMTAADGARNKDFRWRCRGCKTMYTVRTGSVLRESRLPVRVWVFAFWRACASKKGISALQLSREMEITHRSALFVLRRIRFAMDGDGAPLIGGKGRTVEIEETYVGGKPRIKGQRKEKAAVVAMAERDGNVRFLTLERVTGDTIGRAIEQN